eukprot:3620541-Amphidinium_carterae.1
MKKREETGMSPPSSLPSSAGALSRRELEQRITQLQKEMSDMAKRNKEELAFFSNAMKESREALRALPRGGTGDQILYDRFASFEVGGVEMRRGIGMLRWAAVTLQRLVRRRWKFQLAEQEAARKCEKDDWDSEPLCFVEWHHGAIMVERLTSHRQASRLRGWKRI